MTTGIITDGDLKRIAQKFKKFHNLSLKKIMTKTQLVSILKHYSFRFILNEYKENNITMCS